MSAGKVFGNRQLLNSIRGPQSTFALSREKRGFPLLSLFVSLSLAGGGANKTTESVWTESGRGEPARLTLSYCIVRCGESGGVGIEDKSEFLPFFMASSTKREIHLTHRPSDGEAGVAEVMQTCDDLTDLCIIGVWFGDDDAEELGQALAHNTSLTCLILDWCNVGARGLRGIAEALSTNKTLDTLYFEYMRLGDIGAEIMANALASTSSSLRKLILFKCGVGALGSRALADALETNTCLKTLGLAFSEIGDAGATALGHALASNSSLVEIYLDSCGIGSTGSRALADALETNTCLKTLRLDFSEIGDAGATALANALASNSSVFSIYLHSCGIGSTGSRALADALETNTCLKKFFFAHNDVGDAGATALAHAIASTTSLEILDLPGCDIGDYGMSALIEAWGTNLALPMWDQTQVSSATLEVGQLGGSWSHDSIDRARCIRDAVLRKQELLLAFGMAMVPRLGGGPEEQEHEQELTATRWERSAFHYMDRDVFKVIGEAYGAY